MANQTTQPGGNAGKYINLPIKRSQIICKKLTALNYVLRVSVMAALISTTSICHGQTDTVGYRFPDISEFKISYISSLIYPGLSLGAGIRVKGNNNSAGTSRSIISYPARSQHITLNLNWYHHPGFHDNLFVTSEWTFRRTRENGFFTEYSGGPGYSRTFLGGTTYVVKYDGSVSVKKHPGYSYAMITAGWSAGYSFAADRWLPNVISGKISLVAMFPYNSTIYLRPVLEFGLRFNISQFAGKKNIEKNE